MTANQQAQGSSEQELQREMEELVMAFSEDNRPLLHRGDLEGLIRILKDNKGAVSQLQQDKKVELAALLPQIGDALRGCKMEEAALSSENKKKKTKKPVMSDCIPFKQSRPQKDAAADQAASESSLPVVPVSPLLEKAMAIFGPKEDTDTVLYEWTTSYVDESRIFGWTDEAKEVADALVGPENDKDKDSPLFRAAGITGIHGSGKTALAQKVFVHDRIKDTFPLRLWVCVGPPDHKDKADLLYRMLDNLGHDTAKVEEVVNTCEAVKKHAGEDKGEIEKSKIGVLLFILHSTLEKTGYLIVFDDIRAYDDVWYSNLALPPPTKGEWTDRLAYGLPKVKKSAVRVTCRKEDDARTMVRTGRVFLPPPLGVDEGWPLFKREYDEAKLKRAAESKQEKGEYKRDYDETEKSAADSKQEKVKDRLYNELEQMKKEIIVKCLGLPVAIIEAAKGFAYLDYKSDVDDDEHHAADVATKPADTDKP
ncbi:hypothetical protein ABZP36_025330 [Zizania latifolia]